MRIFLITVLITISASANAQVFQWADGFGGFDTDISTAVDYDKQGNEYIAGYFWYTVDFDPGPGVHNMTATNSRAIYLAKYDANGAYVWSLKIDLNSTSYYGFQLDADSAGNVVFTGTFAGSADFDPGPQIHTVYASGYQDVLIARYDFNGNYLWAFTIGAQGCGANGANVTYDASGNIYAVGMIGDSADMDPGPGMHEVHSLGNSSSPFLAKYDANGNYLWSVEISSAFGPLGVTSCSIAPNGDLVITGELGGTADFNPGPGTDTISYIAQRKTYIARYTSAGNFVSVFAFEINEYNTGSTCHVDANGDIIINGTFYNSAPDIDPGPGVVAMLPMGASDVYAAKYSSTGTLLWYFHYGNPGAYTTASAFDLDGSGNIYLAGYFQDTVDFDPGPGTWNMYSDTLQHSFVAEYDPAGNFLGAFDIPTSFATDIAIDNNNGIIVTGCYRAPMTDFDPDAAYSSVNYYGQNDFYLARYSGVLTSIPGNTSAQSGMQLYPNPNNGTFFINPAVGAKQLQIFNAQGQLVRTLAIENPGTPIEINGLSSGTYLLSDGVRSVRFVVE